MTEQNRLNGLIKALNNYIYNRFDNSRAAYVLNRVHKQYRAVTRIRKVPWCRFTPTCSPNLLTFRICKKTCKGNVRRIQMEIDTHNSRTLNCMSDGDIALRGLTLQGTQVHLVVPELDIKPHFG